MYRNLEAELRRRGITRDMLAKVLGKSVSTISTKMNGKYDFTLPEAFEIKNYLGADIPVEELFFNDATAL